MTKIRFTKATPAHRNFDADRARKTRRPYDEVLGEPSSASPLGSTYWKRVTRCPREFGLWQGGLRRLDPFSDPIVVGLLYHRALEHYYRTLQAGGSGDDAEVAAWHSVAPFAQEPGYTEPYQDVERILAAYFDLYRTIDPVKWKVVVVESTRAAPAGVLEWTGRFDLVVLEGEQLWGVEHKSTRLISEDLLSGYSMDLQIPGYTWLGQKVPFEGQPKLTGFIVNVATRDTRPRLERVRVVPSRYHMDAWEKSMRARQRLRDAYPSLGHPQFFGNCVGAPRYFSRCDYFDICHGRPEVPMSDILAEEEPLHGFVNVNRLTGKLPTNIDPDEVT